MTTFRTVTVAAAAAIGLSACAANPAPGDNFLDNVLGKLNAGLSHHQFVSCSAEAAEKLKSMNWAQATVYNIEVNQGEFSPSYFDMEVGKPYILKFANLDSSTRSFRSADFFDNATVGQVMFGETKLDGPCLNTFVLDAESTMEVQVVPNKHGRYRWHDNRVLFGPVFTRGKGFGVIAVHKG